MSANFYSLQGSPSPGYTDIQPDHFSVNKSHISVRKEPESCKEVHQYKLDGAKIIKGIDVWFYDNNKFRIEAKFFVGVMIKDPELFKKSVSKYFGPYMSTYFSQQINTGPNDNSVADAFLNSVCKIEGIAEGSLAFMKGAQKQFPLTIEVRQPSNPLIVELLASSKIT